MRIKMTLDLQWYRQAIETMQWHERFTKGLQWQ